jgi:HIRAN domain
VKQYSIVGQKRRGLDPYLTGTLPGTPVVLVREPGNQYDKNAVMVWIDGKHVGYIPSKQNQMLAGFIDQAGEVWDGPLGTAPSIAQDATPRIIGAKSITGTFARSPNSAYPMVTLSE